MDLVNADFEKLPKDTRLDYTIRKQILWESETASEEELSAKEVEMIKKYRSNDPEIGYNRWPKFNISSELGSCNSLQLGVPGDHRYSNSDTKSREAVADTLILALDIGSL